MNNELPPQPNANEEPQRKPAEQELEQQAEQEREEAAQERLSREERDKTRSKEKLTADQVWDSSELRDSAMKIAEMAYPIPEGASKGLSAKYRDGQKTAAKEYLERAVFGVTKQELAIKEHHKTEMVGKESLGEIRERLMREYGVADPSRLTEADIPKQQRAFKEADRIFNGEDNKITKEERIKRDQDRASQKMEEVKQGYEDKISSLQPTLEYRSGILKDYKEGTRRDISEVQAKMIEDSVRGMERATESSRKVLKQIKERRMEDAATLSDFGITQENSETIKLSASLIQEIKHNLARIGLETAQAQAAKNDAYKAQETLVSNTEKLNSTEWKKYVTELVATNRDWRRTQLFKSLPRWKIPEWLGKLRIAIFDELNGNILKSMGESGTKESKQPAKEAERHFKKDVDTFKKETQPGKLSDSKNLLIVNVARIKPLEKEKFDDAKARYMVILDIYRDLEIPNKTEEKDGKRDWKDWEANTEKHRNAHQIDIHEPATITGGEAKKLIDGDAFAVASWKTKIEELLKVHADIFATEGVTLSQDTITRRAEEMLVAVVDGLKQEQQADEARSRILNQKKKTPSQQPTAGPIPNSNKRPGGGKKSGGKKRQQHT